MEVATSSSTSTAPKTIAGLIAHAAEAHGSRAAVRYKRDGAWHDVSYRELAEIVQELALGLIELGLQPGERLCILAGTRPEWSYVDMAATSIGVIVVPIYQTNSPEECHWVMSDSGACAIVCEDASQLAKIAAVRDRLPELRTLLVIDPPEATPHSAAAANGQRSTEDHAELAAIPLEEVRRRGRGLGTEELERRRSAVRPEDTFTIIYTSGTTGPPKGCVLTHGNYRAVLDAIEQRGALSQDEEHVVYLYLPLAHAYALLLQLAVFDLGHTLAYFGGDTKQIVAELGEVRPTYLPSVPRIFEKIYTLVSGNLDPERLAEAVRVGMRVRELQLAGAPIPDELQEPFAQAEEQLFKNVRAAFGGRLVEAVSGAAPIAKEILEFFYACGVPVMEGYGMTETATAATATTPEEHRFGSVGKPLPGVEVTVADDGELLIKGRNIFSGYYRHSDSAGGGGAPAFGAVVDGWLHTGDLGRIDEDGFVYIVGRKKDLIITAGGKNITPANLENAMKQSRWISQAFMYGDRRPYPVMLITLDADEILPWAAGQGLPEDLAALSREPKVIELVQAQLDRVNANYAQVEQVKRFYILDHDFTQESGELTPSLKVKRSTVAERHADVLEALYAD